MRFPEGNCGIRQYIDLLSLFSAKLEFGSWISSSTQPAYFACKHSGWQDKEGRGVTQTCINVCLHTGQSWSNLTGGVNFLFLFFLGKARCFTVWSCPCFLKLKWKAKKSDSVLILVACQPAPFYLFWSCIGSFLHQYLFWRDLGCIWLT